MAGDRRKPAAEIPEHIAKPEWSTLLDAGDPVGRSRLTFVEVTAEKDNNGRFKSRYRCACSNEILRAKSTVEGRNRIFSCGCQKREVSRRNAAIARRGITQESRLKITSHGMTYTHLYGVWNAMVMRCTNPNSKSYRDYGGRGIRVCRRWRKFQNFYDDLYSMYMEHRSSHETTTLERLDADRGYSPENCVWATRTQQARNRRSTLRLTYGGRTQSLHDWADEIGIKPGTIDARLRTGWTTEQALSIPAGGRRRRAA